MAATLPVRSGALADRSRWRRSPLISRCRSWGTGRQDVPHRIHRAVQHVGAACRDLSTAASRWTAGPSECRVSRSRFDDLGVLRAAAWYERNRPAGAVPHGGRTASPRTAPGERTDMNDARGETAVSSGAQFRQVAPVRLYQRIVEQIEQAITRGDLKPGQRLPSERELGGHSSGRAGPPCGRPCVYWRATVSSRSARATRTARRSCRSRRPA